MSKSEITSERIQDPEKAHAMALAGDELRTKARNCRLANSLMRRYLAEGKELDKAGGDWVGLKREISKQLFEISPKDRWHEDEVYPDFSKDFVFSNWDNLYDVDSQVDKRWQENERLMQPIFNRREKEADELEEEAEPIEYWAGVLHDADIREEYIKAHPNISFTPYGLDHLKQVIYRDAIQEAIEARNELRLFDQPDWMSRHFPRSLSYINWSGPDDAEVAIHVPDEVSKLLNNDVTTIGQIKELCRTKAEKRAIETRQKAREVAQIIADIRSGRAS